jgi:TonB family protein
VMVTIGKSGAVSNVQLLSESPPKQGFGAAARACMSSKRFRPGLDRDGKPAATAVRVNIRFMR